jgi:hypothetical protein
MSEQVKKCMEYPFYEIVFYWLHLEPTHPIFFEAVVE